MSKRQCIMIFGVLIIAVSLFSHLPTLWNTILYVVIGVFITGIAYTVKPVQPVNKKDPTMGHVDTPLQNPVHTSAPTSIKKDEPIGHVAPEILSVFPDHL
jgi:hypothetical protein